MKLIASNQITLTNLLERAIDRTEVTFWHGLSATKHPLGVYDCGVRDHTFGNEFNVTSGKTYTVRVIAKQTKGSIEIRGGIWYTAMTSGNTWDGYAPFTLVGEASEDGLGIYERKFVVESGKTKAKIFIQIEQWAKTGLTTAWRIYDGQVFDENGQPLVTDQNNFGALTSPMAAPDGTYIWKRTITYYTDGTNDTVWEYNGVGEKGNTGANGQTSHVHFAFADNATGGGFSLTTPKAYMGWYADFNESASNDPTKYKWGKWKGDEGAPGKPGDDGKTSYLHLAFASSADGKTSFSFTESGQQYQGYYTDFVQANSTDPTKYTWMDRRAGIEVGGRNLLTGTRDWSSNIQRWSSNNNGVWHDETEEYNNLKVKSTTDGWNGWHQNVFVKAGEYYTLSYYAKADTNIKVINSLTWEQSPIFQGSVAKFDGSNSISDNITTEWKRYSRTVKITGDGSLQWRIEYDGMALPNGKWYIAGMKLERGNIATDYSQAPEDTQEQIDSKADSSFTQEQLNALKEQSELHQKELDTKADLDVIEKWYQEYLNYVNTDNDNREKSEAALLAISERVASIVNDLGETKERWSFIDTYMDVANEGLVIGKQDGSTNIKVSNDRISMFSNGDEVMWISQNVLHIANGVFVQTLQIGNFRFESLDSNGEILGLRYLGG